jgi:hypothetical protein
MRAAVVLTLLIAPSGSAMDFSFTHPYGEPVDRGSVTAHVGTVATWDCTSSTSLDLVAKKIVLTGGAAPPGQTINCFAPWTAALPTLPAGTYEVTGNLVAAGGLVVETATRALDILPIEGRCNPDPALSPSIMTRPKEPAAAFVARVNADPALKASLGNPAVRLVDYQALPAEVHFDYPPLEDIPPAMDRLVNTGLFELVARNGRACFSAPPPDRIAAVLEYYHAGLDHYFYTANAQEIADIDAGKVGPWTRTGRSFRVNEQPGCELSSPDTVVYRFSGIPGRGPSSHLFTRDRAECFAVDQSRQWALEGVPFFASTVSASGTCSSGRVPLYRMWRPFGDSNHRFATDRAVVTEMVGKGWVDEGPAMCVLSPG